MIEKLIIAKNVGLFTTKDAQRDVAAVASKLNEIIDHLNGEDRKEDTKRDVYKVTVDRSQSLASAIESLKFENVYVSDEFKEHYRQPWATGTEAVQVELFKLGRYISNEDVAKEYESRNLKPDALAAVTFIKENLSVLDEKKWIGVNLPENFCVTFYWLDGGRSVNCYRGDDGCDDCWWFAGVRKVS